MARALGRYELLRPLARGGMAEVYLARRRAAGVEKWLVVKRMRPERTGDPRFLDLFVREARLSMSLVHQNIVPVFDFGRIDDQVFLAMERVEGRDLGSSLARAATHRMPPMLAAFVAAECCQALDYAHQRKGPDGVALGIVHRDVTPRNVLLSWSGEVKLTDFGIAALAGEATSRLLGTPQYMAPEQARSEPIDPRADIYAIGLVLREALSGIRSRPGADRETILDAARRGALLPWPPPPAPPPTPSSELALGSDDHGPPEQPRDQPPAELVAIVDKATAGIPGDRYRDARTMLEDLDHYIVGERSRHKAESPARQLASWLAGVWEGARDEVEADAAVDAEHLVSFLDDGAFDVVGTGTVRSLAATAADDAHVGAPPGSPDPVSPGSGAHAVVSSPPPGRSTRISSSSATVASGSIHTLAARQGDDDPRADSLARGRKRRSIALLAGILLVGAAAVAVIGAITYSGARDGQPVAAQPLAEQPAIGQPTSGQPAIRQPTTGQPITRQPAIGQPTTGQPATGQPTTGQSATGRSRTAQSTAEPPATGRANVGQPATGQPATGQPVTGQPATGQPATGQPIAGQPTTAQRGGSQAAKPTVGESAAGQPAPKRSDASRLGSATPSSGSTVPGSSIPGPAPSTGSNSLKPASCRVRINLTPWAYYTVDHDAARHETPGTIDLAPGEHRLHVWNPELHIERDIVLNVPIDRDTMNFSEPLQPPALHPDANASPQP